MSKFKKVLMLVALAGFVGACSGNSGGSAARDGNQNPTEPVTAPEEGTTAGFSASHSGNFDIVGWAGNSLLDVMSAEDLHARVADFDGLILAIDSFGTMGMAEGRGYAYDRNARILRLHGGGQSLEITAEGAVLSADDMGSEGDQGQGQVTKEAPRNLPCRLYEEEVKEEVKQEEKEVEQKGEQGQTQAGEKVPAEQGQTGAAPTEEQATEQGQTQDQNQVQEVQQPEEVIVRCEQTLTSEQEQGQTQAQVKPESRTEIIHVVLNLTPVVEQKQEQVVEKEVKQEEVKQEQKQEVKEEVKEEVKQEQKQETKVEEKAPVKEEKAPVKEEKAPEQKQEQKGEVKKEEKKEEKKPTQGGGQEG